MKTKKLSKLLLLFLCTINLIGCNNEETESAYHLELTVNSCKIILGGSESVKLTAHENTTLDITDGEVVMLFIHGVEIRNMPLISKLQVSGMEKPILSLPIMKQERLPR
ncbi:hypothetical protein ACRFAY_09730 [Bacteroides hominis]|uniref:hypothetical protein n=1 Tax=Bacteroides hominis TaxID=2763023 RepID=UPI001D0E1021|nr:hypothetical protein [Bacteroides hominis (ex Afrizal et al. 2022)]MCC2236551.1 hypothetical protein [Bacteroides hominis (ex Afrizal et al. 2022)]MCY6327026.1 hypothetical protein [Bacteroides fragilis]